MKLSYSIDIRPRPKSRPRFGAGRVYSNPDDVEYEKILATHLRAMGARPKPNPCIVDMTCTYKRPKNVKEGSYFIKRPDCDNLGKSLDALNGVAWYDDRQIVQLTVSKDYGEKDNVTIEIEYLSE